jgi:triosephosphate isomerase
MKANIRQKYVVGNWKMHTTSFAAAQLTKGICNGLAVADHVTVVLCPPFPYLSLVGDLLKGSQIALGAQNMYPEAKGAFTGEVSSTMLRDLGCKYVIVGHSERRHKLGESDQFVNEKVLCALAADLKVILCVGETLEQRHRSQTETVLDRQLSAGLRGVGVENLSHLSIAYEPVWAIGNQAHHATPQQGHDAHSLIRRKLSSIFGDDWAEEMTVQYGGSVGPENAAAFFDQPGIDGVLIGGASLDADEFLAIIDAGLGEVRVEKRTA